MTNNEISVPQLQDFSGTLKELSRIVNFLKEDFGGDCLVWFDAGEVIIGTK